MRSRAELSTLDAIDDGGPDGESNWTGFADSLLGDEGETPCQPPDSCDVCMLYSPLTPQLLARIREQGAEKVGVVERRESLRAAPPALLKAGQWSRKYARCQGADCRSPEAKHYADGKCRPCYARDSRHADRRAS